MSSLFTIFLCIFLQSEFIKHRNGESQDDEPEAMEVDNNEDNVKNHPSKQG